MALQAGPQASQSCTSDTNGHSSQTTSSSQLERDNSTSPGSSNRLPRTRLEISDVDLTPPTSSSGLSSQAGSALEDRQPTETVTSGIGPESTSGLSPRLSTESYHRAGSPVESSAALKRTSSGLVKRSSIQGAPSLKQGPASTPHHTRNSSVLSNGTTVTELSQQLRTRLSYAMVKVQNGWESKNLEEIESLTVNSPHMSPRSPVSPLRATSIDSKLNPWPSHNTTRTSTSGPDVKGNTSGMVSAPEGSSSAGLAADGNFGHAAEDTIMDGWQERALAPPADIVPRPRRRPHPANAPTSEDDCLGSPISTEPKQRTASQNAAMEADAVETLLFLASPGNSGTHLSGKEKVRPPAGRPVPTSAQVCPSRSALPADHERVAFSPRRQVLDTRSSRPKPGAATIVSPADEIDQMIDNYDDSNTDSGVENGVDGGPRDSRTCQI